MALEQKTISLLIVATQNLAQKVLYLFVPFHVTLVEL